MARFFRRLLFLIAIALGCMVPISLFIDPAGGISAWFFVACLFITACNVVKLRIGCSIAEPQDSSAERHARQMRGLRQMYASLAAVSLPFLVIGAINVAPNRDEFIGMMSLIITALFALRDAPRREGSSDPHLLSQHDSDSYS